ncbi:acyl-CoA ligase (AMP-forming), exosortase A system-associated [Myxococcus sp. K15C18031901]|uniref:acyl-CoA ligase (AMP-forming), exosortase A system-associated n=1 Tax=Myxococcus dinghuensis TaxID=2906761 RepID=UPI0020A76D2C|nr:acyl-CoA ligase (AMP-forming), exosortase A system-associated [Myxococcus dinghuensis]MCP3102891.1 acyl-CoA ligase (AMP-forming), exosortase A system-associated [Myxococcus dinghuensis]
MPAPFLLHHLIDLSAGRTPDAESLKHRGHSLTYAQLASLQDRVARGLELLGLERSSRVGIYLSKCHEGVATAFGATKAGHCFVPINPVLKAAQVEHILRDCDVRVLVTSRERYLALKETLPDCPSLRRVVLTAESCPPQPEDAKYSLGTWAEFVADEAPPTSPRMADVDMAAILYTSGSTGKPKGVVISHRNLVSGAASVSTYLENRADDRLLAVLPLSFDAGFSQLTTAFTVGGSAVLLDYTMPMEVLKTLARERITGLTAVPPLYIQLAELDWPEKLDEHLRYFANTGGKMPRETLARLRARVPAAKPYLMYGLTEAFRSSFLPPAEVDRRPDSIGRAIPNQELLVLRPDGTPCEPNEPGELVHRGSTVSLGYWNDPEKTAERFRLLPRRIQGLVLPEMAVFSGDTVQMDEEGFLYFIGRNDEMLKSSGYRISPVEIEEALYSTGLVAEAAAVGLPDERLGHRIAVILQPREPASFSADVLLRALQKSVPPYMVPHRVEVRQASLPRNGNGKIDRKSLLKELLDMEAAGPALAVPPEAAASVASQSRAH